MNPTAPVASDPVPPVGGMSSGSYEEPISVKDWLITYIIVAIPVVGFIMLFVWAFSETTPRSKANWAKASLLLFVISLVIGFCIWGGMFLMAFALGGSSY